jgi:ElaB/YqjD/DUF883 family membrane-anchored ribosome-binding protein
MGESTDQIRQEIDRKRDDAAGKIDQLQHQVQDTADQMRANVQDTTGQVIDQVKTGVDDTIESVKQNIDLRQQIEERPLLALGAALVGGFLLGGMTGGRNHHGGSSGFTQSYQPASGQHTAHHDGAHGGPAMGSSIRSAIQKTGIEDTISNAAAALLGSVTDQLKDTIDRNFPGFNEKMESVQHQPGGFADKAREAQSTTTAV